MKLCAGCSNSRRHAYLGGRNTVADLGRRIVYTTHDLSQADFPAGDEVIILTEDPFAARTW